MVILRAMKVIVFAADGLIGRRLTERALGRGHTVTAVNVTAVSADARSADQSSERLRVSASFMLCRPSPASRFR